MTFDRKLANVTGPVVQG